MKLPEWIWVGLVAIVVGLGAYYATGGHSARLAAPIQGLNDPDGGKRFLAQHLQDVRAVAMQFGGRAPTHLIVEFADYQCPFCRASEPALEQALQRDSGLAILFVQFPLAEIHPAAFGAAIATACADEQGRGYPMHRRLMTTTDWQASQDWEAVAKAVGAIDLDHFRACVQSDTVRQRIESGMALGRSFGLTGTPLFISERGSYSTTLSPEAVAALTASN